MLITFVLAIIVFSISSIIFNVPESRFNKIIFIIASAVVFTGIYEAYAIFTTITTLLQAIIP